MLAQEDELQRALETNTQAMVENADLRQRLQQLEQVLYPIGFPANTRHLPKVGSMLAQRLVFAGLAFKIFSCVPVIS